MKPLLKISIVTNLGLLGLVIPMLIERRKEGFAIPATAAIEARPSTAEPVAPPPGLVPAVKPEPFRWSQIEAADYKIYVSNLRGIGCPEATIRDIIAADVDASVYVSLRDKLNRNQVGTSGSPTASLMRHSLETELQEMNREEAALIATLLGWPVASNQIAAEATAGSLGQTEAVAAPVALPLVFREVDLAALKLDGQANVFANLGQRFLQEIGGTNQDPNDPAYRERWQRAEARANQQLKGMIGMRAYQAFDLKTRSAALAQADREANP